MLEELLIRIKAALEGGGFDDAVNKIKSVETQSQTSTSQMLEDINKINNADFSGLEKNAQSALSSISNSASSAWSSISQGASSIKANISEAFAGAKESVSEFMSHLQGMEGMMAGVLGGMGVAGVADVVVNTSAKAEVNKVLLKNMTQTAKGAETLYTTVDNATNKTLVSMQSVIPALNKFKASTGANEQTLTKVTDKVANFGSYVYAMTGSAALADTAMMDLSKGLDGAFASLDQYGITEKSLIDTGLWSGKADDVEGYMRAVEAVVGPTDELMNTFTGLKASMGKVFSVAGKQIGQDVLPVLKDLIEGFIELNKATGGNLTRGILTAVGALGSLVTAGYAVSTIFPLICSGFGVLTGIGDGFVNLAEGADKATKALEAHNRVTSALPTVVAGHTDSIIENTEVFQRGIDAAKAHSNTLEVNRGVTNAAIQEAQALSNATQIQTVQEKGLTNAIRNNSAVQSINNKLQNQSKNIKERLADTGIKQSIINQLEAMKLRLLNGETSIAALYEKNYEIAKQRSLIASIRNAATKASEAIKTGVLTAYTVASTAAEKTYAFVKNTVTLANIKSAAAKVADAAKTVVITAYTAVATAAERAYNFVKELQIGLFLRTAAAKGLEYTKNILLAGATLVMTTAERAYNAIKNFSLATTLRDIAAKGLLAVANAKTAISAGIMTVAQIGLNAAMMAAPYAIIVVALIAMVAAFKHLYENFPDFKNGIDEITAGLKELFGALMSGDFDKIGEIFKNAWDKLPEWLGNIDQQIEPAIQSMIDAFSGWASKIDWIGELQKGIGNLTSWIYGAALNLANWLVEGLKNFSAGLTEWLDGGGAGGQEVGQSLYDGIVAWWNANSPMLMELFNTVFMTLIPLMAEIGWKIIQALGLALFQGLQWLGQQIAIAWENNVSKPFWDWLNGIPGWILNALMLVIVNVVQWVDSFGQQASTAGYNFVMNIIQFIQSLPGMIGSYLTQIISRTISFGGKFISTGISAFSKFLTSARSYLSQVPGVVYNEIVVRVPAMIRNAAGAIFNAVKSTFGNVVQWAKQVLGIASPGYIARMVKQEMIHTADFISAAKDPVVSAIKNVASSMVNAWGDPNLEANMVLNRKINTNSGFEEFENINSLNLANNGQNAVTNQGVNNVTNNNFGDIIVENPVIRDDDDIDKLENMLESLIDSKLRTT